MFIFLYFFRTFLIKIFKTSSLAPKKYTLSFLSKLSNNFINKSIPAIFCISCPFNLKGLTTPIPSGIIIELLDVKLLYINLL